MNVYRSQDFHVVQAALAGVAARADSQGHPLDPAGRLWASYLDRVARADSDAAMQIGQVARGINVRADAHYLQGDGVDRATTYTLQPQRPNALLAAIPMETITPWARTWTAVTVSEAGVAVPWQIGSTDTAYGDHAVGEVERPTVMLRYDLEEMYGEEQVRQTAISAAARDAGSAASKARRAMDAHLRAHEGAIYAGIQGVDLYSLTGQRQSGWLTSDSDSVTYGTTAANTALAAFKTAIQLAVEADENMPAPDTVILTQRCLNALEGYFNFEAGGVGDSSAALRNMLTSQGINSVIVANVLKAAGGADKDLCVFFSSTDPGSLRYRIGLRPAPVKTWDAGMSRQTAYLSSLGGLWADLPGSVHLYTAAVAAT